MSGREIKNSEKRFLFWASPGYPAGSALCGPGDTTLSHCWSKQGLSPKRTLSCCCIPREEVSLTRKCSRNFLWRWFRKQGNLPSKSSWGQRDTKSCLHTTPWLHLNRFRWLGTVWAAALSTPASKPPCRNVHMAGVGSDSIVRNFQISNGIQYSI